VVAEEEAAAAEEKEKAEAVPNWANAVQDESTLSKKDRNLQVAVGAIAQQAFDLAKGFLGDATGFVAFANTLKNQVINLDWHSEDSKSRKANVQYQDGTGEYATYIIEKHQFSEKSGCTGVCKTEVHTLELKITFKKMTAKNLAAKEICQSIIDKKVGDFLEIVKDEEVFKPDEVFKNVNFEKKPKK